MQTRSAKILEDMAILQTLDSVPFGHKFYNTGDASIVDSFKINPKRHSDVNQYPYLDLTSDQKQQIDCVVDFHNNVVMADEPLKHARRAQVSKSVGKDEWEVSWSTVSRYGYQYTVEKASGKYRIKHWMM